MRRIEITEGDFTGARSLQEHKRICSGDFTNCKKCALYRLAVAAEDVRMLTINAERLKATKREIQAVFVEQLSEDY